MKARYLVFQAYLHVLSFALLAMGILSLMSYWRVEQPTAHTLVLLPDGAFFASLLGLALLAAARQAFRVLGMAAMLLFCFALYTLSHNYLAGGADVGVSWVSGFLRARSALALTVLLLLVALLLSIGSRKAKRCGQVIGVAVMLLGTVGLLGVAWPTLEAHHLGFKYSATHIANVFCVLLGVAVILLGFLPRERKGLLDGQALAAGGIATLLTCIGWYVLSQQGVESINRESELLLTKMEGATTSHLEQRLELMQRMAERWQAVGRLPSSALWQQEARSYLRDFPQLGAVAVLNNDLRPYWLEPQSLGQDDWLKQFLRDPSQAAWLKHVQVDQLTHMSSVRRYAAGQGNHALIALPLQLPGHERWLLVASENIQEALDELLGRELYGFSMRVYQGDSLIYGSPANEPGSEVIPIGERKVTLHHDMTWRLVSYIGNPQARYTAAYLPALAMLFGLTLSFFLMVSQRLARLAIERSRHLAAANGQLEESLQRQLRMQALNQRIMQFSLDVLCSIDVQGRFSELSPSCEAVLGYKPEELIGRSFIDFVLTDDRQRTQEEAVTVMAGQTTRTFRNRYRHRNGRTVHILWSADWSEEEQTMFAVAHDISLLVQNEAFAEEQHEILSMISTDRRLSEILTAICLMVEAQEPSALCSVLLTDAAGQHLLTGAAPSLPQAYSQAVHGMAIGPKAGSSGTAAFLRQLVVVEDIRLNPLWEDYRCLALEHGLRACCSLPLHSHQGAVLGVLEMYRRQAHTPNNEHLQLLASAAQLAAIAIEREHDRLRLQESEQRFRSLFTFNPDPVFSFDLCGRFQSMNAAGVQLTGFSEAELLGQRFVDVVVDEELPRVEEHFAAACAGQPQRYELHARDRQNNQLTLDVTTLPIVVDQRIIGVFGIAKDVSAERRAGQALRERDQFFKLSLEMFCMIDMRGNFIQVNPAFAEVLRYPASVLIGYSYLDLIHHDDRAKVKEAVHQLQCGELVQGLAIRTLDATNQQRWLELSAALGEDQVIYCVARDITERRTIEQQIRRSTMLLSMAGHTAKLGGWSLELPENMLSWSEEMCSLLEYPVGVIPSFEESFTLYPERARKVFGEAMRACAEQGKSFDLDLEIRTANGRLLDARITAQPVHDESGQIVRMVGAFQDISERNQTQRELQRLAGRLTTTLESISDGFYTLDNDWRFTYVNGEAERLLGVQAAALLGTVLWFSLPGVREGEIGVRYLRAAAQGTSEHFEVFYEPLKRWFEVHAFPSDEGIAAYFRDISERRRTEQELQATLLELERSNRELQEFAFVASHDLQEPLRKIQAFAERLMVRSEALDESGRDYLQRMTSAAARMQSLIIDLLDYSRVSSRGQPFQRVQLAEVLSEVLEDMESTLERTQAQVDYAQLPTIMGDATQLRQVLQNLISNAVKFQAPGIRPVIRIYTEHEDVDTWNLCVEDNGIGFDEKYLDRIFNPFQRLHSRQAYAGTGIGLAVVKKIVERHGAHISAISSPGKGSVFSITFPASDKAYA
ncbi:MAG: PAS domain S-box protein [Pseudomonas sp.]|uniref:PAS domain S-box protein n=1 Tax=Pseudomonas sp. TaxID=306 RepID=UPI00299D03E8|nr:PAS domain S-box protein [Pseudomonas sp.]MDX1721532.1 PAS domain S-box protein [Pseudomonas sp.]